MPSPSSSRSRSGCRPSLRSTCGSRFCRARDAVRVASSTRSWTSASSSRDRCARATSSSTGSSGSMGRSSGSVTSSGSTSAVAERPRCLRKRSSSFCSEVSAWSIASWPWAARSSARKTSSLLTRPTSSRAWEAREQRLRALQALAGHAEELALEDNLVEGGRDVDGDALPGQLEGPLLTLAQAPLVAEVVVGGVGAEPAQERLGEAQAEVAGHRQRRGAVEGVGPVGGGGGEGAPGEGKLLGRLQPHRGAVVGLAVARDHLGEELRPGHRLAHAGRRHRVRRVEHVEVPLEGGGDGVREADALRRGRIRDRLRRRRVADHEGRRSRLLPRVRIGQKGP